MSRDTDKSLRNTAILNVVDLEATCWDDGGAHPPNEIIEIGVTELNLATLELGRTDGILVRPIYGEISPFCTQLTTLTWNMLRDCPPFTEAIYLFRKAYQTKKRIWASYGEYDRRQFQRQCVREKVGYPFDSFHINIKAIVAGIVGERVGIDAALSHFGLTLEGTHHRGADDSRNIARLYTQILTTQYKGR